MRGGVLPPRIFSRFTAAYPAGIRWTNGLSQRIARSGLDIQLRSIPEDLSESLVFCMAGHPLLASVPVINYLKATLAVVPISFDTGQSYYLAYTQKANRTIEDFITIAKQAASSEANPWKQSLLDLRS